VIRASTLRAGLLLTLVVAIVRATQQSQDPLAQACATAAHLLHSVAYSFALILSLRIRRDYCSSGMRLAWTLMAGSALTAVVRHLFEAATFAGGWAHTQTTGWVSLRQVPVALSLLLLAGGLAAMWFSYTSLGLGLRFRMWDAFIAALLITGVFWMWPLRAALNDARSVYPVVRNLQSASPVLLAIPALLGLVLHRISQEMGGGRLAVSLRYLVAFLGFRLAGLLMGTTPQLSPYAALPATAAFHASSWLFALAVFYRCQLTVAAEDLARRYEANPDAEIRQLTRAER
jgi:hypothetical protein